MNEKDFVKLSKKMEKLCKNLHDIMSRYSPKDMFNVLMSAAPADDVEIVALFVTNMQAQFLMKMCDIVRKIDTCDSDAQICESCESKEGCPDRKDTQWIQ